MLDFTKTEIDVHNQEELDSIPVDYHGRIYIKFGRPNDRAVVSKKLNYASVEACGNASVEAWGNASVEACGNASVEACGNASVEACGNASVEARGNASVEACGNASVEARDNASVEAWDNASVEACGNASVEARGNASVEACGNASVEARDNASVEAWDNASVEARDNASVEAWDNASVEARDNASVEACGNASVEACGNASVEARDNASVEACGFSNVVRRSSRAKISTVDKARCIDPTEDINTFMLYHGIRHTRTKSIWYKAVHKYASDGSYHAEHNPHFTYEIGKTAEVDNVNSSTMEDCGRGLHIASLSWALDFGKYWGNLAILEVEVKTSDIILPVKSDGKVRVPKLKVLREVPLEECGLYGKILARKKEGKDND